MYFLTTSGIGYSEQLCKDVVDWFITKFLPKHKLYIDIRHDDLKNDYGTGFCDVCPEYGDIHRPRDFVIDLQSRMSETWYIITLIHELVHLKQMVRGQIKYKCGRMIWDGIRVTELDYAIQPHEIEAYDSEWPLYLEYMWDKTGNWHGDN